MNNKISIQELANGLIRRNGLSRKDAETFVRTVFAIVSDYLYSDKIVKIKGFGTFKLISVESRASVDVNTGERIIINGYTKVTFTPDAALRDEVNKPFGQFETVVLNEGTSVADMERMDLPELPLEEDDSTLRSDSVPAASESLPEPEEPENGYVSLPVDSAPIEDDEEAPALPEPEVAEEVPLPTEPQPESILLQEEEPMAEPVLEEPTEESVPEEPTEEFVAEEPVAENLVADDVPETDEVEVPVPDNEDDGRQSDAVPHADGAVVGNQHVDTQHVETLNVGYQTVENQHIVQVLPDSPTKKGRRSAVRTVCGVILVLVLMTLSYLAGYYRCFSPDKGMEKKASRPAVTEKAVRPASRPATPIQSKAISDSTAKDSMPVPVSRKPAAQPAPETGPAPEKAKVEYPQVKGGAYEIVGVKALHQLKEGETLCNLSRKYYGSKDFVNYIAVFNEFDNPDIVPVGVQVKLPELKLKRH